MTTWIASIRTASLEGYITNIGHYNQTPQKLNGLKQSSFFYSVVSNLHWIQMHCLKCEHSSGIKLDDSSCLFAGAMKWLGYIWNLSFNRLAKVSMEGISRKQREYQSCYEVFFKALFVWHLVTSL